MGVNASAAAESLHLRGDPSPDDRLLADTRGSQIAAYIDAWKRRVEQVGTLHFPEAARSRSLSRNPVLEVAIRADGSLQQVVIRRSSGQREIDNAAIRTVRLAAPFDPFPPGDARALPGVPVCPTSGSSWRAGPARTRPGRLRPEPARPADAALVNARAAAGYSRPCPATS